MEERATAQERADNLQSIQDLPVTELPDGPARRALEWLASQGRDAYAYRAAGSGKWFIWNRDRRYTPAEWLEHHSEG